MFEQIKALLHGSNKIKDAYDETFKMLDLVAALYTQATALLLDGVEPTMSIHKEDKRINALEQDIRRDILEHLSFNPQSEVNASLVLSAMVGYVERVGDYVKNIEELARMYGRPLRGSEAVTPMLEIATQVGANIKLTRQAMATEDRTLAIDLIRRHRKIKKACDKVLEKAFGTDMLKNDALVVAMYARYLKRISAGLKNAATTVVMPFDRIGYSKLVNADNG